MYGEIFPNKMINIGQAGEAKFDEKTRFCIQHGHTRKHRQIIVTVVVE